MNKVLIVIMFILLGTSLIVVSNMNKEVENSFTIEYHNNKNLALPDLDGKEYLGNGEYYLDTIFNLSRYYNIYSGINTYNGALTGDVVNLYIYEVGIGSYTLDLTYLSGRNTSGYALNIQIINNGSFISNTRVENGYGLTLTYNFTGTSENEFRIVSVVSGSIYNNYQFKLQIEKGSIATPYVVPKLIPVYKDNLTQQEKNEIGLGAFGGITKIIKTISDIIKPVGDFINGLLSIF